MRFICPALIHIVSRSRNDHESPENRGTGPHGARTPVFGNSFNFREVLIAVYCTHNFQDLVRDLLFWR